MQRKEIASLAVLLCAVVAGVWLWLSPAGLKPAPKVTFAYLDGRQVPLQQLRGRPVLVTFWASTCSGCLQEMPHLIALYDELSAHGLEIIGVAMAYDPPNRVLEVTTQRQLPYPVSLDLDGHIARAFGDVMLTPTSFLISAEGRILMQKIGKMDMHKLQTRLALLLPAASPETPQHDRPTQHKPDIT